MKIYATFGMDIQNGKDRQAWEWAGKLANYANDAWPDTPVEVLQRIGGNPSRIIFATKHNSLGDREAYRERYEVDAGFMGIVNEAVEQELILTTTIYEAFYRIRS